MVSVLAAEVSFAASDPNRVTITSINIYSDFYNNGTGYSHGALFFFTPAKPGLGNCLNPKGNAVWINSDDVALFRAVYDSYRAGTSIGFGIVSCTGDDYYPIVSAISF